MTLPLEPTILVIFSRIVIYLGVSWLLPFTICCLTNSYLRISCDWAGYEVRKACEF